MACYGSNVPSSIESAYQPKVISVLKAIADGERLTHVDLSDCGLTSIPSELFQLGDSLVLLNLGGNQLSDLPDTMIEFKNLRILFFAQNQFENIPLVLGRLPSLFMLSFKSNQISHIDNLSLGKSICWLILTDNKISELPSSIGELTGLRKLMLAGNELTSIPDEMQHCQELELVRLAANKLQLESLPDWFWNLPKLSWLAVAGNIASINGEKKTKAPVNIIEWSDLIILEKLGEGASGVIFKAKLQEKKSIEKISDINDNDGKKIEEQFVAVKIFKGGKTSDGLPEDEMKASEAAGSHPNSFEVLGRLKNAPGGQIGLVMPLIPSAFKILGGPPSFTSVTRDTYEAGKTFKIHTILKILCGISSVCCHLHRRGISHGDLYAHNILVDEEGACLLSDFGASSFYEAVDTDTDIGTDMDSGSKEVVVTTTGDPSAVSSISNINISSMSHAMQAFEVRAFGCLIEDLINRIDDVLEDDAHTVAVIIADLKTLFTDCMDSDRKKRPSFSAICHRLEALSSNF